MKMQTLAVNLIVAALLAMGCAGQQRGDAANGGAAGSNNYIYGNGGQNGGTGGSQSGYNGGSNGYGNGTGGYGNGSGQFTPEELRNPNSILAKRIIYFDYDQSGIRPEYQEILNAHASLLASYPNLKVRLEGHADERGSRKYNVALSERRGYSVLDYMQIKGASANQMEVIGYGEEIPAIFGHNEDAWSKNRRVEIRYAGE